MTEQSGSEDDKVDKDFLELLNEFKESKDKEKAAAELKASLPAMERQLSAPLWDQMLNPGKDGKVDPNKLLEYKIHQMDWSDLPEEVVNAEKEKIQNEVKMIGSSLNSLELLTGKDITGDGEIANNEYGNFENEPNNNNNTNGNN